MAETGGTAVTGYTVFSVPSGVTDEDAGEPGAVHTLSGVEKHVVYRFYARAINAAGMGPPSNLSNEVVLDGEIDPDAPPTATLGFQAPMEGDFGTTPAPVSITLSKPAPAGGAHFHLSVAPGTAVAVDDYLATPLDVTIPAGETFVMVEDLVRLVGDQVEEPVEFFTVIASNPVGVSFPQPQLTATFSDDEWPDPRLSVGSVEVVEGDAGSQTVWIPLAIGEALPAPMSFDLDVTPTGPAEEGVDYAALHLGGLTLAAGQTAMSVALTVYGDKLYEADEGVVVTLSNPQGGKLSEHFFASIPFVDNDPLPTLSIADVAVIEGDPGKHYASLEVSLTGPTPGGAGFALVVTPGTATEHRDFVSRYSTGLEMEPGSTRMTVEVPYYGDLKDEDAETFFVALESVVGATPGDTVATVTLLNDDPPSKINVSDVSVSEGELAQFTVSLDKPSGRRIGVDLTSSVGTAQPGVDFAGPTPTSLVFPEDTVSFTVNVATVEDARVELHESYVVNLRNPTNADLGRYQGLGRILNDDLATLVVDDASVVEGGPGTVTMRVPLRLSAPMSTPVWADVTIVQGTASVGGAGADVQSRTIHDLLIDGGRTRVDFEVAVLGDAVSEGNETFKVEVSNVRGAIVGRASGTGTILDDDTTTLRAALRERSPPPRTALNPVAQPRSPPRRSCASSSSRRIRACAPPGQDRPSRR